MNLENVVVYGEHDENTITQFETCAKSEFAERAVLCADGHYGYNMPIGGVIAYRDKISPAGVGYDIACGNKAVRTNLKLQDIGAEIPKLMDLIWSQLSFGIGRVSNENVDHELFDSPLWYEQEFLSQGLLRKSRSQLGTVGSGNHYVDLFYDEQDRIWVGVHFGSRGLGHGIATHFLEVASNGETRSMGDPPDLLDVDSEAGTDYLACMELAGEYAYAGRDFVCQKVVNLLGAQVEEEVHNHHNFAWKEKHSGHDYWVVRKGATPAWPGQKGFVGGSMGDISVILEGIDSPKAYDALRSTVHGAGRIMSRTRAAGKKIYKGPGKGKRTGGEISREMMEDWVRSKGVELRGAGEDESPHCYKRIEEVLAAHSETIRIVHTLQPIGVCMAGDDVYDPFKD